jgi:hypothetical protein
VRVALGGCEGDAVSKARTTAAPRDGDTSEPRQPVLPPRQTALLASALLVLVVVPLPLTIFAALPAVPVFVYALVALPASRERTIALLSSGLAFLAPVTFLLLFA